MKSIKPSLFGCKLSWAIFLLVFAPLGANAANCTVETALPQNQQQIGSGSAIAGRDGVTTAKGDQVVYVKVTNQNVLGVSYTVSIAPDATPPTEICSYSAILLPKTTVILSGALFAQPPIGWKVTVSVGDESDAGVLTYTVHSLKPAPKQTPK